MTAPGEKRSIPGSSDSPSFKTLRGYEKSKMTESSSSEKMNPYIRTKELQPAFRLQPFWD
ncbi:hypothetical protein KNP414_03640 [Paenibacillus mucilaginosus KNP414]|uniref:Uncharacterized protein n=1 Tax=Paenibacillus mucilaginosus (strain KNP414) TaxID=1036673 RepID=F8FFF6_PAEMK|nr:hypothetical protein KNP414_03640 [Paenibacillus mucilaginosus KNP414]